MLGIKSKHTHTQKESSVTMTHLVCSIKMGLKFGSDTGPDMNNNITLILKSWRSFKILKNTDPQKIRLYFREWI